MIRRTEVREALRWMLASGRPGASAWIFARSRSLRFQGGRGCGERDLRSGDTALVAASWLTCSMNASPRDMEGACVKDVAGIERALAEEMWRSLRWRGDPDSPLPRDGPSREGKRSRALRRTLCTICSTSLRSRSSSVSVICTAAVPGAAARACSVCDPGMPSGADCQASVGTSEPASSRCATEMGVDGEACGLANLASVSTEGPWAAKGDRCEAGEPQLAPFEGLVFADRGRLRAVGADGRASPELTAVVPEESFGFHSLGTL